MLHEPSIKSDSANISNFIGEIIFKINTSTSEY